MTHLIGLLCVFSTGSLLGIRGASALYQRVRYIRLLQSMLNELSTVLRYQTPTVWELLDHLCSQPMYEPLGFLRTITRTSRFSAAWSEAVSEDVSLGGEEKQLLLELGGTLGMTDTEGQLCAISLIQTRMTGLIAEAERTAAEKGKLYRALGILGGAAAAVILA